MSDYAIETNKLTKKYHGFSAVDQLDLQVRAGSVFGFLGPNGAGKTTTINMLLGIIHPSGGTATVLDHPAGDKIALKKVGFLPEKIGFHPFLTGIEFLYALGKLSGMGGESLRKRVKEALDFTGLGDRGSDRIGSYSRGMQQRLGLAQALLHQPDLIILDEPTSALDPIGRREVRDVILYLKRQGCTIFLNSHLLSEIEKTCDEVAILKAGRVIEAGAMEDLLAAGNAVEIEVEDMNEKALAELRMLTFKLRMEEMPPRKFTAYFNSPTQTPEIARALVENGVRLKALIPRKESLEDLFVRVVEGEENTPGS
jgi:ABC-2 type transport system ATP-binding protein